jgi:hypothetical protein
MPTCAGDSGTLRFAMVVNGMEYPTGSSNYSYCGRPAEVCGTMIVSSSQTSEIKLVNLSKFEVTASGLELTIVKIQ